MRQLKNQYKIKYLKMDDLSIYLPKESAPEENLDPGGKENDSEKTEKIKTPPDVLLVADPSSLSQPATDDLIRYIEAGNSVLLLADPLPFFWTFQDLSLIHI